jgi:hypothetical protein
LVTEVAVPPPVVTLTAPVVVPVATVAVIWVALFTVNDVAAVLLKETAVAPVKLVPVITTEVPTGPLAGVKLVIVGAAGEAVTVKLVLEVAIFPEAVTVIGPMPTGVPVATVAVIWVALFTV